MSLRGLCIMIALEQAVYMNASIRVHGQPQYHLYIKIFCTTKAELSMELFLTQYVYSALGLD